MDKARKISKSSVGSEERWIQTIYNETSSWHSWSNWRIYLSDFAI